MSVNAARGGRSGRPIVANLAVCRTYVLVSSLDPSLCDVCVRVCVNPFPLSLSPLCCPGLFFQVFARSRRERKKGGRKGGGGGIRSEVKRRGARKGGRRGGFASRRLVPRMDRSDFGV